MLAGRFQLVAGSGSGAASGVGAAKVEVRRRGVRDSSVRNFILIVLKFRVEAEEEKKIASRVLPFSTVLGKYIRAQFARSVPGK